MGLDALACEFLITRSVDNRLSGGQARKYADLFAGRIAKGDVAKVGNLVCIDNEYTLE